MRATRILRSYNQIALAVLLTWGIIFAALVSFMTWSSYQDYSAYEQSNAVSTAPLVSGEEFETANGIITAYKSDAPDDREAVRDVRYVAMNTGKVSKVSYDPDALIYGERAVGQLGRVALVKTRTHSDRPVFDFVFVSFPDLNRYVVAQGIDSLDTVQELDDRTFSAIVWDEPKKARFIVVDAKSGTISATRELNFDLSGRSSDEPATGADATTAPIAGEEYAPRNRFAF